MSTRTRCRGHQWWETERRGLIDEGHRYPSTWIDVVTEQLRADREQLGEMFERALDVVMARYDFDLVQMICPSCGAQSDRVPWQDMPDCWKWDCPVCGD